MLLTLQHLVGVILHILYPPVVTQLGTHHLLRHAVLCDVDHWVPILSLKRWKRTALLRYLQHSWSVILSLV